MLARRAGPGDRAGPPILRLAGSGLARRSLEKRVTDLATAEDGKAMGTDHEQPYVDALSLTDTDLHVYEAIASLEQAGQPPTSEEITAACGLDDDVIVRTLHKLLDRGVATAAGRDGEPAFALARHDWSAVPDTPAADPPHS